MKYTVYKTTNLVNNKIYIGKHQTDNLNDDYLGSGKLLVSAIEKYGRENFKKEILFVFETEEEMNVKEAELVTEEFVKEDSNYNLCPGGQGGWGYVNSENLACRDTSEFIDYSFMKSSEYRDRMSIASKRSHEEKKRRLLSESEFEQRKSQYESDDKSRGVVGRMAKLWNVHHTTASSFIRSNLT